MKKAFFTLLFLLLAAPLFAQDAPQKPLAFTHVTVIDCTGTKPKPDQTVVIDSGKIAAIGKTGKVKIPADAQVVDATGTYLIPGLWDMHIHWYDKEYLPLFIANGVTGVRIMWGSPLHHQWRKEVENGTLLGPRMVIASTIVDGPKPVWPGSIAVRNAEEGRKAVATVKQNGADFVKVYSLLPREAYFAIAEEAKKQGISFGGHVPEAISVAEASDAGQKSIEHLTGVLRACSSRETELQVEAQEAVAKAESLNDVLRLFRAQARILLETYDAKKAAALFARFKKNRTWHCPTLTVLRSLAFINDETFTNDARIKYMPPFVKGFWNPKNDFRFKDIPPEGFAILKQSYNKSLDVVGAMRRAGVELLAGTDCLNPYCFPGFSLHDELALLVQAGLTPMEALQAATRNPARFLGKEKEMGTIEKGKIADLVLLDADPLQDIKNTTKINIVVFNGRLFDRAALDKMLSDIEARAAGKTTSHHDVPDFLPAGFCLHD